MSGKSRCRDLLEQLSETAPNSEARGVFTRTPTGSSTGDSVVAAAASSSSSSSSSAIDTCEESHEAASAASAASATPADPDATLIASAVAASRVPAFSVVIEDGLPLLRLAAGGTWSAHWSAAARRASQALAAAAAARARDDTSTVRYVVVFDKGSYIIKYATHEARAAALASSETARAELERCHAATAGALTDAERTAAAIDTQRWERVLADATADDAHRAQCTADPNVLEHPVPTSRMPSTAPSTCWERVLACRRTRRPMLIRAWTRALLTPQSGHTPAPALPMRALLEIDGHCMSLTQARAAFGAHGAFLEAADGSGDAAARDTIGDAQHTTVPLAAFRTPSGAVRVAFMYAHRNTLLEADLGMWYHARLVTRPTQPTARPAPRVVVRSIDTDALFVGMLFVVNGHAGTARVFVAYPQVRARAAPVDVYFDVRAMLDALAVAPSTRTLRRPALQVTTALMAAGNDYVRTYFGTPYDHFAKALALLGTEGRELMCDRVAAMAAAPEGGPCGAAAPEGGRCGASDDDTTMHDDDTDDGGATQAASALYPRRVPIEIDAATFDQLLALAYHSAALRYIGSHAPALQRVGGGASLVLVREAIAARRGDTRYHVPSAAEITARRLQTTLAVDLWTQAGERDVSLGNPLQYGYFAPDARRPLSEDNIDMLFRQQQQQQHGPSAAARAALEPADAVSSSSSSSSAGKRTAAGDAVAARLAERRAGIEAAERF